MNIGKISKIIAWIFIAAGFFLWFGPRAWFPDFYNPVYNGTMAFLSAFLIIAPRFIFIPKNQEQKEVVDLIQASIVIALVLSGLGGLGLFKFYEFGFQYDKLIHFLNTGLFMMAMVSLLNRWYKIGFKKSIVLSIVLIYSASIGWELYEYWSDIVWGTQMMGHYGQFIGEDTTGDVIMNCLGIIVAIVNLNILKKFGFNFPEKKIQ